MSGLVGSIKKFLPESIRQIGFDIISSIERKKWEQAGRPIPPPNKVKQEMVTQVARENGLKILIETGTYLGNMIFAQRKNFQKLYSIELSPVFHKEAVKRFRKHDHIEIIFGDSAQYLPKVIDEVNEPALFWLDGHFSGGETAESHCPVMDELQAILASQVQHAILIDDARCFGGTNGYPTIKEIETLFGEKATHFNLQVEFDIIRIVYSL